MVHRAQTYLQSALSVILCAIRKANTAITLEEPWKNLQYKHELYVVEVKIL